MNKIVHYIGLDVHKESIAVAIAPQNDELRSYGVIGGRLTDLDKLLKKVQRPDIELRFCYEAGPCGYGIYRHLQKLNHPCLVVAPSLTPKKASDRVKTDRRDAQTLARLFRAGELTAIYVPDREDEAIRDLVRAREAAIKDQRKARQRLKGMLLRLDFRYQGKSSWGAAHLNYLATLKMPSVAQQIVFEEYKKSITHCTEQLERLTNAMNEQLDSWRWKPVVQALMTLRGVQVINAMVLVAELGDLSRFTNPRQLMAFLGLTPSEHSSGEKRRVGSITKAGNEAGRRALVEAAHHYRIAARLSPTLQQRQHGQTKEVQAIAWKAQLRLCARYRKLKGRGKKSQIVVTAVARELAGFVWAIACTAMGKAPRPTSPQNSAPPADKTYQLKPALKYQSSKPKGPRKKG